MTAKKPDQPSPETDWEGAYLLMQEKFIETHKQLLSLKSELAANAGLQGEVHKTGKIHELKTWPEYFQEIVDGKKTF